MLPLSDVNSTDIKTAAQKQFSVDDVQNYLNGIQNFKAAFKEYSKEGHVRSGRLWLVRKSKDKQYGKFKFVYDAPDSLEIMADGNNIVVFDIAKKDTSTAAIEDTPAIFLLRPFINLKDPDLKATLRQQKDIHILTISQSDDPKGMGMAVYLTTTHGFLQIVGWAVRDQQGYEMRVELSNVERNIPIDEANIFKPPF